MRPVRQEAVKGVRQSVGVLGRDGQAQALALDQLGERVTFGSHHGQAAHR